MNVIRKQTDENRKKLVKQSAYMIVFLLLLCFAVVVYLMTSFAWFAKNRNVSAEGMKLRAAGNVDFGDEVIVDRYYTNSYYTAGKISETLIFRHVPEDDAYYLWDTDAGDFSVDENGDRIPFTLTQLIPGERINFSFTISRSASQAAGYRLSFAELDADTFTVESGVDAGTYSIMGICHMSVRTGDRVIGPSGDYTDKGFLLDYAGALPDGYGTYDETVYDEELGADVNVTHSTLTGFTLLEGAWGDSDSINVTVQLWVDLTNYNQLHGTTSNLLSEKILRIGYLQVEPVG